MPEEEKELLGTHIGNYEVTGFIGAGGMGSVYLGVHPEIGKKVAIKILAAELSDNPQMSERFVFEAKAVNQIEHPNIVEIYDFGRLPDNRLYYTMELLKGQSLDDAMADKRFSVEEANQILQQIASALGAVHSHGIIHRDLKPENIFVNNKGGVRSVKLLDFGIAKLLDKDSSQGFKTATGVIMGTPYYMSPEQARGEMDRISLQSDIYSLGIILYQMLSGELPISGQSMGAILVNQITQIPKPLTEIIADFPAPLWDTVNISLAKEPEERYESVEEFASQFQQVASPIAPGTIFGSPSPPKLANQASTTARSSIAGNIVEDKSTKSKLPMVLIALFVLMAGGGAAYFFLVHNKGERDEWKKEKTPVAAPVVTPPAVLPIKKVVKAPSVYHVTIKASEPKVKVNVKIPGKPDFFYETPFTLNVAAGEVVTLKAQKEHFSDVAKSFTATKDETITLALEAVKKASRRTTRRHNRRTSRKTTTKMMKPTAPMPVMKPAPKKDGDGVLKIY